MKWSYKSISFCNLTYTLSETLLSQSGMQKFFYWIGIPLVNAQSLYHLLVIIQKPQVWVWSTDILYIEAWKLLRSVTLDESLNLWIPSYFSATYSQFSIRQFLLYTVIIILLTALVTWISKFLEAKILQLITGATQKVFGKPNL